MAIKFTEVSYQYSSPDGSLFDALKNINLDIAKTGEFIALIGETGSGKSTLVQHMNALMKPSSGQVEIYGIKINHSKSKKQKLTPLRQKVGLVFQFPEYQLFEETVMRDIMFGPRNFNISKEEAKQRARKAIIQVGLDESYLERSPFNLSGGEKKRVSIAGILAMEPDILVLDEPTSGLDPKGRDALIDLFTLIHNTYHKTIIIITHDMNIVHQVASRVLVMREGELVFDGTSEALFNNESLNKWNLEEPDLIKMTKQLEQRYSISMRPFPKNIDQLFHHIKDVI
ncbi:MAG: energy-coupling factor transporter ATPase [Candidatus Izimaplasma sp.]|nr:energy-coupling factor transporter ATPase [Candidatus Izimaplasma bacterium]